jgi:hypothetical protein
VYFKSAGPRVLLAADVTAVRLLARVDQAVSLQVAFGNEPLMAAIHSTDKRPFASLKNYVRLLNTYVDSEMSFQITRFLEAPLALDKRTEEKFGLLETTPDPLDLLEGANDIDVS